MASDDDHIVAFQLLLEDIAEIEDRQKGKQKEGCLTDLDLTLGILKQEIEQLQTSRNDHILAVSTSTAVAMDQRLLSQLNEEESQAERDHQLAVGLNSGAIHEIVQQDDHPKDDRTDAVSTVREDIMDRRSLADSADIGEGPSHWTPRPRTKRIDCASCLEVVESNIGYQSKCGHSFCDECTKDLYLASIRDEELYPPRCCGQVFPPGIALRMLDFKQLRDFGERAMEYAAKDRVYCADPMCSRFIPPFHIEGEVGTCSACKQQTHVPCRALAHPGIDCPLDVDLQNVLAIAQEEEWKRCSRCHTMVELGDGCNHITCR